MRNAPIQDGTHLETGHPLPVRDNPRPSRDYLVSLRKTLSLALADHDQTHSLKIEINYVPDRLIADANRTDAYFDVLAARPCRGIEELANAIVDDFSNELIPRWIGVALSLRINGVAHMARVEDRQPLWENNALLQRLV